MKKFLFQVSALLFLAVITTAATCGKDDEDSTPEFTPLVGQWELLYFTFEATEQDDEVISSLNEFKKNGHSLIWEFFDTGKMVATEENSASVESNWELNVTNLIGHNIDKGTLILTGDYADQVGAALELDELAYSIETSEEAQIMNLAVDASSTSEVYKKVIITYTYHKI